MEKMHIESPAQLPDLVRAVCARVAESASNGATVVALHGDLGAGKTTFMKTFAKELGVAEEVTSPTFVIMKGYELADTGAKMTSSFSHLYHLDAYRIEDIDEMRVLGFEALLSQKDIIICIEWAERIAALLPKDTIHLQFEIVGEERDVTIS